MRYCLVFAVVACLSKITFTADTDFSAGWKTRSMLKYGLHIVNSTSRWASLKVSLKEVRKDAEQRKEAAECSYDIGLGPHITHSGLDSYSTHFLALHDRPTAVGEIAYLSVGLKDDKACNTKAALKPGQSLHIEVTDSGVAVKTIDQYK